MQTRFRITLAAMIAASVLCACVQDTEEQRGSEVPLETAADVEPAGKNSPTEQVVPATTTSKSGLAPANVDPTVTRNRARAERDAEFEELRRERDALLARARENNPKN